MNVLKNPDFYRPKTYLMLLAILCTFGSVIFSFVELNNQPYSLTTLVQENSSALSELSKKEIWKAQVAFTLAVVTGMCLVYGVTIPNERVKQMKFGIFAAAVDLFQFMLMELFTSAVHGNPIQLGEYFPILTFFCILIAMIFLRNEQKKLKKMNRLWD